MLVCDFGDSSSVPGVAGLVETGLTGVHLFNIYSAPLMRCRVQSADCTSCTGAGAD